MRRTRTFREKLQEGQLDLAEINKQEKIPIDKKEATSDGIQKKR
jgi:hypothetical protein